MSDKSRVYLEVDGEPQLATDCHWLEIASCGCVGGVSRAMSAGEVHFTGEDAFHCDSPKVKREESRKQGITYKLVTLEQYRGEWADKMRAGCTHTPKWGIDPIPVPDGWTWKTLDANFGRRSYRKHIVPVEGDADWRVQTAALCGKAHTYWKDSRGMLSDCVPCAKCEKLARTNPPDPIPAAVVDVPVAGGVL
jgi:hypothetical protein